MKKEYNNSLISMDFKDSLFELMQEKRISHASLAYKLNMVTSSIDRYFSAFYYPKLKNAIKMCEFFNCSLDFLFARSFDRFSTSNSAKTFSENLVELIKNKNISIAQFARDLNTSTNCFYNWKNGKYPRTATLIEIADYFAVSLDYLIGKIQSYND